MRVLLVNPATAQNRNRGEFGAFPNGVLYMAAVLEKAGHQVAVLDSNVDDRQPADFSAFQPDIVGFSVLTGPNIDDAIEQSLEFKRLFPDVKVVWGNVHASMLPQQTLAEPYIDFVVVGAGEYTLLELADHLEKGDDDLAAIPGLAYKQDGEIIVNEPRPFLADLDELPDPAWHLVDVRKYWDISLSTSRGCPFRCTFCYNKAFHQGQRGELSAERAVGQIEELQKRYGARKIKFYEDNFTANRKRLRRFCRLIIDRKIKIKWDCETRAGLDEEDIFLMARAGCITTGLGVESASPRILEFLHKGTTIEQIEKTFWLLVKYKILPRIYIIGGLPTETVDEFQMTQHLIRRLDSPPYQYMMYLPYPGTALYDYCLEEGLITPPTRLGDWARFTLLSATQTNLSQVPQAMVDDAKARFTSVYALRPLRFTLKHNPAYFMSLLLNPKKLGRAVSNFTRYYLTRPVEWSRGVFNRQD
jgi:radical SAM superfamily enzyme YgiQ (UPF0313 family)